MLELTEFLVDRLGVEDVGASYPHRVAYHPTCLTRYRSPRPLKLLRAVRGIDVLEAADGPLDGAPRACADASCLTHAGGDGRAVHLAEILAAREGA